MTLLSGEKLMSFKKGKRYVTIKVPHGTGVLLSRNGGGVIDKSIQHKVDKAGKTLLFAVELRKKSNK